MPEILFPYTNVEVTRDVNRIPNQYGLLNALDLFPSEPMATRDVRIDIKDGVIEVLAAAEPGAPGGLGEDETEKGLIVRIPHFPHFETIRVADLQGVMENVNGVIQAKSLDTETAKKLLIIRTNHAITREYIRIGALKGEIKDGRGRVLYNLFTVFDITKKAVDFKLGTAETNIREKCEEVIDHVQTNLKGESMTQVECLVATNFFEKLVSHPNVEKFWLQSENGKELARLQREMLGRSWGRVFEFGDILWREYKGAMPVKDSGGNKVSEQIVADDTGHAYPSGTMDMFKTFESPAHHIDEVNMAPDAEDQIYISVKSLDHGEGFEFKSQSNALAIVKQPECLVEATTSD